MNPKYSLTGRIFRIASIFKRRRIIEENGVDEKDSSKNLINQAPVNDFSYSGNDEEMLKLSEVMVEQSVGYMAVPMGLAGPLLIDGVERMIPLATEEPSVIAACSYIGKLSARYDGIHTFAGKPIMIAQIFVENCRASGKKCIDQVLGEKEQLRRQIEPILASMKARGGGWKGLDVRWLDKCKVLAVNIRVDVRDSLGANLLNSAAEKIGPLLESITGGHVLMAILSNQPWDRTAGASLRIPVESLKRPGFDGEHTARRIVMASRIAREDTARAVTHNKGIMNGITALALATCNDTRAIESAVHAYACQTGRYQNLSRFWMDDGFLHGEIELPLLFASIGGAVGFHPTSRWSLDMLGNPNAQELSRIAAAVGLAQNLAALRALVSEGIQAGHMCLHARRLSYSAGARGPAIGTFSKVIHDESIRSQSIASKRFKQWQETGL